MFCCWVGDTEFFNILVTGKFIFPTRHITNVNFPNISNSCHKKLCQCCVTKQSYLPKSVSDTLWTKENGKNLAFAMTVKLIPEFWRNQEIPEKFRKTYEQAKRDLFQIFYLFLILFLIPEFCHPEPRPTILPPYPTTLFN